MLKILKEQNQVLKPMRKYNSLGHLCDLNLVPLSDGVFIILSWMFLFTGPLESDPAHTGANGNIFIDFSEFQAGFQMAAFFRI